jgi:copper oxidase (laccase) domain-containing protein
MTPHASHILHAHEPQIDVRFFTRSAGEQRDPSEVSALLGATAFASTEQPHGSLTCEVTQPGRSLGADGLFTSVPGLWLTCRCADCQCFALFDPIQQRIGVLHAGWKGLVCGAVPACVEAWQAAGSQPADILVCAYPSLCTACSDFTDPRTELPAEAQPFVQGVCVDLQAWADAQWLAAGVLPAHLERLAGCTRCKPQTYWSYRSRDAQALAGARNTLAVQLRP